MRRGQREIIYHQLAERRPASDSLLEAAGPWPRWIHCEWCGAYACPQTAHEELRWRREHAGCVPVPVRDALEAGWGQEGVHGGGLDPYLVAEDYDRD